MLIVVTTMYLLYTYGGTSKHIDDVVWMYGPDPDLPGPGERPSLGYLRSDFQLVNQTTLDNNSLSLYRSCDKQTKELFRHASQHKNSCRFIGGSRRPVALVSFPGSGSTWVRGLLEQVTGVCTGAEYCDALLRNSGFIGESITSTYYVVLYITISTKKDSESIHNFL